MAERRTSNPVAPVRRADCAQGADAVKLLRHRQRRLIAATALPPIQNYNGIAHSAAKQGGDSGHFET